MTSLGPLLVWLDIIPFTFVWPGGVIGIGLGFIVSAYLLLTWDPKNLRPKDVNARTARPSWMPIVVIAGVITGRILLGTLSDKVGGIVAGSLLTCAAWTFGFVAFQIWWYRPRD